MNETGKLSKILILFGTLGNALSKWYLIWLFAFSTGGPEAVGVYALILAIGTPVFTAAQLGLRAIFVSSKVKWPWEAYLKLRLAGIFFGSIILLGYSILNPAIPLALAVVITIQKVTEIFADLYYAKIQYFNRMATLGIITSCSAFFSIAGSSVAVLLFDNPIAGVLVVAFSNTSFGFLAYIISSKLEYTEYASQSPIKGILRSATPVTVTQFLTSFLYEIPVIIIGLGPSVEAMGQYAAAAYLITAANLIGSSLQIVFLTQHRNLFQQDGARAVVKSSIRLGLKILPIGLISVPVVVYFGPQVLLLIYGPGFAISRYALAALSSAALASVMTYLFSIGLLVLNQYGRLTVISFFSCITALMCGGILISFELEVLFIGALTVLAGTFTRMTLTFMLLRQSASKDETYQH